MARSTVALQSADRQISKFANANLELVETSCYTLARTAGSPQRPRRTSSEDQGSFMVIQAHHCGPELEPRRTTLSPRQLGQSQRSLLERKASPSIGLRLCELEHCRICGATWLEVRDDLGIADPRTRNLISRLCGVHCSRCAEASAKDTRTELLSKSEKSIIAKTHFQLFDTLRRTSFFCACTSDQKCSNE